MPAKLLMSIFFLLWVVWGSRFVIDAFERLSIKLSKGSRMVVAALLIALGTSLPELFVAIASGVAHQGEISLGNIMGANVANASLVIGGASILSGSMSVVGDFVHWEFLMAFLIGCAPLLLMLDGELSRLDGLILIVIYLMYFRDVLGDWRHKSLAHHRVVRHGLLSQLRLLHHRHTDGVILKLIFGILLMMLGSHLLVKTVTGLAVGLGILPVWIGIFVISIGTTLPELVLSAGAIARKESLLVTGNLLGSIVANSTLIAGILALINPVKLTKMTPYITSSIGFVVIFSLFWLLANKKKRLDRWEGMVLVGVYFIYLGISMFLV